MSYVNNVLFRPVRKSSARVRTRKPLAIRRDLQVIDDALGFTAWDKCAEIDAVESIYRR